MPGIAAQRRIRQFKHRAETCLGVHTFFLSREKPTLHVDCTVPATRRQSSQFCAPAETIPEAANWIQIGGYLGSLALGERVRRWR
jgi:hypothetical protein